MPPERTKQLVYELDAWYRSHKVRQKDLAAELQLKPQQLAEILATRNNPTGEQILTIQDFLKANDPMSTPVFEPKPDRPPNADPNEPKTLHQAKEMIEGLRAELASAKAPPVAAPPVKLPLAPATKPTTVGLEHAKSTLANATVEDLRAGINKARSLGNLEAVGVLQTELESRVVTSSSNKRSDTLAFDSKDPKTWSGKIGANVFPVGCDNPKAIGEYLSTLSMDALRSHLKGAPASATEQLQQKLAFAELQNRKRSR